MTERPNIMTATSTTDLPTTPNGHSAPNGEPVRAATKTASAPAPKKQRKRADKRGRKHVGSAATAAPPAGTPADTELPPVDVIPADTSEAPAGAPETTPTSVPEVPAPAEAAAPIATPPAEGLQLRMKIWTHPGTTKRYLMATAFMRDVVNGTPVNDVMIAYAMRDDDTMIVTLNAAQWNALPFFYFQEVGPAPRATPRPLDMIVPRGNPG